MDSNKKRSLRKKAKLYFILTWVLMGLFFLLIGFICLSSSILPKPVAQYIPILAVAIPLVSFPCGAMCTMFMSQGYRGELFSYMRDIKKYRSRKFCNKILDLLIAGETSKAVNLYRVTNIYEDTLDDYLYGVIITECRLSSDEALKEIGIRKTSKLLEAFNPDKIKF
jgi:hypothetical protein